MAEDRETISLAKATGKELFDWREVIVLDIEANGLLEHPDYRLHCAWTLDLATGEYKGWRLGTPELLVVFLTYINDRVLVAHNGLGYDFLAIAMEAQKAGLVYTPKMEVDTLVLCRMLWALDDLIEPDVKLWRAGKMPGNKMKTQGIEAWGYRLGEMKGDYSAVMKDKGLDPWAEFNEDMYTYNKQDVVVNYKLLLLIFRKLGWFQLEPTSKFIYPALPVHLEMEMQRICLHQERRGLGFNRTQAVRFAGELANMAADLDGYVSSAFADWWEPSAEVKAPKARRWRVTEVPKITLKRYGKNGQELAPEFNHPWAHVEEGARFVPIKRMTFNLGNRHHLAKRLVGQYGWKPRKFGGAKGTDPIVDEATIKAIPDNVLKPDLKQAILNYYVISKTLATLTGGNSAWLKLYDEDTGTIHGRCNPLGTITHRAAHDKPNLGNIPSVELEETKDKAGKVISKTAIVGVEGGFGEECRELFGPAAPFDTQTGTDVYALEVFTLANYLIPYDGGRLATKLEDPDYDIHVDNATICVLPRKDVKNTFYKTIYGSGAFDIGLDVWKPEDKIDDWFDAPGVALWIRFSRERLGDQFKMPTKREKAIYGKGKFYQNKLLDAIEGLKPLRKDVGEAAARGWIKAIDGRKLSVRKQFAALNALLQGSGSIICKFWIVMTHRMLLAQGLQPSILHPGTGRIIEARDYNQIAWVHDETQWEHHRALGTVIGETAERAIKEVTPRLGLRVTLRTDFKVGNNWAACH